MYVETLGTHRHIVTLPHRTICCSYGTPVVVAVEGIGWFRSNQKGSRVINGHIEKFLGGITAMPVPQSVVEALADGTDPAMCVVGDANGIREFKGLFTPTCDRCGSDNVCRDAAARWDSAVHDWVLTGVHDCATCQDCDNEGDDILNYGEQS